MKLSVPFVTYSGHIGNKWSSLSSGSSSKGSADTPLYAGASSRFRDRHTKSHPSWKGFGGFKVCYEFQENSWTSSLNYVIHQLLWAYRCQISNLHPECIIWELLHPFGSNNQSLVEETSNEVNSQKTEPTERREDLWSLMVYIIINVEGFCVIADCLYGHDEYYGASAELGLRSWAHCTGVQLKQVETVVFFLPVIQHHLQWALGITWRETKVNIRHYKLRKGERVQDCI